MTEIFDLDTLFKILGFVAPLIIGYLVRQPSYQKFKSKFHQGRELFDSVDDALYNDKIDEAKFREIFDLAKKEYQKGIV